MLVEDILDQVQSYIHDKGTLFSREDLLDFVNDGYRDLLLQTHAVRRPFQIDIPGRTAWSASQDWESVLAKGTFRRFTFVSQKKRCGISNVWEVEFLDGLSPTDSQDGMTHLWERAHMDGTDHHFRFALQKWHERPTQVYWDDKRLAPISTKELDQTDTRWWTEGGEPFYVTEGTGRENSLEIFEVVTSYNQVWDLQSDDHHYGTPRHFSSDDSRTYGADSETHEWDYGYTASPDSGMVTGFGFKFTTLQSATDGVHVTQLWEKEQLDGDTPSTTGVTVFSSPEDWSWTNVGVGLLRGVSSTDRQYLPCAYDSGDHILGTARDFHGSANALTVWEVVVPLRELTETETPGMVPDKLHKFLKYYALQKAFNAAGEAHRPDLAQHFGALYQLGVGLLAALGTPSLLDRVYAREQIPRANVQAPPRVRFPSTFERMDW